MKKLLILCLFPLLSFGQMSNTAKHVWAGLIITSGTSILTYNITEKAKFSLEAGVTVGLVADAGHELVYDKWMKKGNANWGDFGETGLGIVEGLIIAKIVIDLT